MSPALVLLLRLQARGWLRQQLASPARIVLATVGVGFFVLWSGTVSFAMSLLHPRTPAEILDTLPAWLTGFALVPLVFGTEERAIAFSAAEADHLFPGPFTRRQIVTYKLVKMLAGSLVGAILFSLWARRFATGWGTALLGSMLALQFVNLLATCVALAQDTLEDGGSTRVRRLLQAAVATLVLTVAWRARTETLGSVAALAASPLAHAITTPMRPFAHVFASATLPELAGWAFACVAINVAGVATVFALDRGYLEAAAAATQRRQARIAAFRQSGIGALGGLGPARSARVPRLRFLGGAGAIVRRQVLTALRTSRGWLLLFSFALGYGLLVSRLVGGERSGAGAALGALLPGMFALLVLLPAMLRFDFRADLDQIEHLKTLPLSAFRIAAAELCTPVVVFVALEWVALACIAATRSIPPLWLLAAGIGVLPAALVLVGMENLVFLLLPSRLAVGQAAMAFSGRRVLLLVTRMVFAGLGGGIVAGVGTVTWIFTRSPGLTYTIAWAACFWLGLVVTAAVAWAFERFDVSRTVSG